MAEPKAIGTVMAMLVTASGKPVKGGAARGQLYVSPDAMAVIRPPSWEGILHTVAVSLLVGSVVLVIANLVVWRSPNVLWIALAAQVLYWVTLPARRRSLAPRGITAAELDALRRDGRTAIFVPSGEVMRAVGPASERGLRRPARFELPEGALEIYVTAEAFDEIRAAIGRA